MKLSPSAIGIFKSCPRCFWLEKVKNVKRPRGIMASLPGGIDRIVKARIDTMRMIGEMFPEIEAVIEGVKFYTNQTALNKMRNWRSGLVYSGPEGDLSGALDDLMMTEDGLHIPTDFKTKGSPTTQADSEKYYTTQLDCYKLMLEANGMPATDFGILIYFTPEAVHEKSSAGRVSLSFNIQIIKIDLDVERAKKLVKEANDCVKLKEPPDPKPDCEHCLYFSVRGANDVLD